MIKLVSDHGSEEKEIKAAMKVWRDRVPNQCEDIRTWKEILESRIFI